MYNRHPRWHQVNRNKRSVTLDLNMVEDLDAFKDLVRISDVVVSNSRPAVLEKFGLTYPELKRIKPDIILACLSAFGATGPYGLRLESLSSDLKTAEVLRAQQSLAFEDPEHRRCGMGWFRGGASTGRPS